MGFTTKINWQTGREVLCCDFCGKSLGDPGIKFVKKKSCPFGYCQAYATCNNCWPKNNKKIHLDMYCDVRAKEFDDRESKKQRILDEGNFIVVSALGHNKGVKVIFRNKERQEKAFWIDEDKYPLKPLGQMNITTLKEYEDLWNEEGLELQECRNINIYDDEEKLEVLA